MGNLLANGISVVSTGGAAMSCSSETVERQAADSLGAPIAAVGGQCFQKQAMKAWAVEAAVWLTRTAPGVGVALCRLATKYLTRLYQPQAKHWC